MAQTLHTMIARRAYAPTPTDKSAGDFFASCTQLQIIANDSLSLPHYASVRGDAKEANERSDVIRPWKVPRRW